MSTESKDWTHVAATLEALRQELARLSERVAALEASAAGRASSPPERVAASPPAGEGLSEELVLVIGAAIAAFLGKKPHIRQIRLLRSDAWAQQGRTTVHASHALSHAL
jgi:methylmalonyl-CoA carboxyltransferase large subunit